MTVVGYMQGTDPGLLSKIVAVGNETAPLGNGWDNHGKYIRILTKGDGIDIVVGYLHKFCPTQNLTLTPVDLLFACKTHDIPVIILVPENYEDEARTVLGDATEFAILVTLDKALDEVLKRS